MGVLSRKTVEVSMKSGTEVVYNKTSYILSLGNEVVDETASKK